MRRIVQNPIQPAELRFDGLSQRFKILAVRGLEIEREDHRPRIARFLDFIVGSFELVGLAPMQNHCRAMFGESKYRGLDPSPVPRR